MSHPAIGSARVAIIMGSDSDWKVMKRAKDMLDRFGIESHQRVVSAHRTPHDLAPFAHGMQSFRGCPGGRE